MKPTSRPGINRAKHLSRVAVEYSQLLYHAEKVRKQQCVFVDQLQKVCGYARTQPFYSIILQRIDKIHTILARDLDVVFSAAILSVTNPGVTDQHSTAARAQAMNEISECLLIYETLERWDAAEEVIRQDIVVPFVKKARSIPLLSISYQLRYKISFRLYTWALYPLLFPLSSHGPHFLRFIHPHQLIKTGCRLRTLRLHRFLTRSRVSHTRICRHRLSATP